jgi:hypothetical protein
MHTHRLRVVSPSRVNHHLFGKSPQGHALRPTVIDLVRRGVMRGLDLERRWRVGAYFYSLSVCLLFIFSKSCYDIDGIFFGVPFIGVCVGGQAI